LFSFKEYANTKTLNDKDLLSSFKISLYSN